MKRQSKSLMQSEIFIIIMIIIALLYVTITIYASKLEKENQKLIDINNTTCIKIKDLSDINDTIRGKNINICIKLKDLLDREKMNNTIHELNTTLQKILGQYRDLNRTLQKNKKPPLITLSEDKKEFRFDKGKASLPQAYKEAFTNEKLKEIIENIKKYDCDTIEVYGYTDTQPLKKIDFNINIDRELHKCLIDNRCSIDNIKFFSNLELGMKRAISIVNFLKEQQKLGKINQDIVIKPYSAGQFIDEYGRISTVQKNDNKKRRRIEIRLSRSKDENNFDTTEEHNVLEQKLYQLK